MSGGDEYGTYTSKFFGGGETDQDIGPTLKFFLKDDYSTIIYKTDLSSKDVRSRTIDYIDYSIKGLDNFAR